jgi:hypothetical protein
MRAPVTTTVTNKGFGNKDQTRTRNAGPRGPFLRNNVW